MVSPNLLASREVEGFGEIILTRDNTPVYVNIEETGDSFVCTVECLNTWPPVLAEDETILTEGVDAEIGTVERPDGLLQVTINGIAAGMRNTG